MLQLQVISNKKEHMKLDIFSSLHPSDQAELFTGLVLYIPVPQTADIAEKLFFGSCITKT